MYFPYLPWVRTFPASVESGLVEEEGDAPGFPLLPLEFLSVWATEGFAGEQRCSFFFITSPGAGEGPQAEKRQLQAVGGEAGGHCIRDTHPGAWRGGLSQSALTGFCWAIFPESGQKVKLIPFPLL